MEPSEEALLLPPALHYVNPAEISDPDSISGLCQFNVLRRWTQRLRFTEVLTAAVLKNLQSD